MFSTSRTLATTGRVCLLFAAATAALSWVDSRPAIVLDGSTSPDTEQEPGVQTIDVNVMVNGGKDADLLLQFRARREGNTFAGVPLFDPLTPEQRAEVSQTYPVWAEWMPYQAGQAKKAEDLSGTLAARCDDLDKRYSFLLERVQAQDADTQRLGSNANAAFSALGGRIDDLEKRCDGLNSTLSVLDARTSAPADVAGRIGGGPTELAESQFAAAISVPGPSSPSPFLNLAHKALDAAAEYVKLHVAAIGKEVGGEFESILGRIAGVQTRLAAVKEAAATPPA